MLDAPFSAVRVGAYCIRPTKRPEGGGFIFVGCPIFGRQGRGVLHTPHKRPDRGEFKTMGRAKFLPFGAYNMEVRGVAP